MEPYSRDRPRGELALLLDIQGAPRMDYSSCRLENVSVIIPPRTCQSGEERTTFLARKFCILVVEQNSRN